MQYSLAVVLALLPGLSLAAPAEAAAPTPTTTAASEVQTCLYSTKGAPSPTATVYAAYMPNPSLNASRIEYFFNHFSFACLTGRNFTARELGSTPNSAKPVKGHWFGGILHTSNLCTSVQFEQLVDQAMQDGRESKQYNTVCTQYKKGQSGANAPFDAAAKSYFDGLSK